MDIRRWLCFLIQCILIQNLDAKTVSLNDLIAAEKQLNQGTLKPRSSTSLSTEATPAFSDEIQITESQETQVAENTLAQKLLLLPSPLSLFRRLAVKAKLNDLKLRRKIKTASLKSRKKFHIKSPLKPKKLNLALKPPNKKKNLSRKREVNEYEDLKQKHVPLLKSLSLLFDNLLNDNDASDSNESEDKEHKRYRIYSEEEYKIPCSCSNTSPRNAKSTAKKKATTPTPSFSAEIPSSTKSLTYNKNYDDSTYRSDKIIPVLLPRNTASSQRNNNGPSKRSGTSYNGDFERNISRDHRDHEYNTGCGGNDSCKESNENYTDSPPRSYTSSIGHTRTSRKRNNTTYTKNRKTISTNVESQTKNTNDTIGKNKLEVRRNETESEDSIRESSRRLRGSIPEDKVKDKERLLPDQTPRADIQPEIHEESTLSAADDSAGHKRITYKNGPLTTEDEKIRSGNETERNLIRIERNPPYITNSTNKKAPVVLIFDGYSVTRDKNGQNRVSGKTIHIRSTER